MSINIKKIFLVFAEIMGLIVFILSIIIRIFNGDDIYSVLFEKAYTTLDIAKILRSNLLLVNISIILIFTAVVLILNSRRLNERQIAIYNFFSKLIIGYLIGELMIYYILDGIFYKQAFISYPYMLGFIFLIVISVQIINDREIITNKTIIKGYKNKLKALKYMLVLVIAFSLIVPNIVPMLGFYPKPPEQPETGYGGSTRPFEYNIISIEHSIPSDISDIIHPEVDMANNTWYTRIYIPITEVSKQLPVSILLHGYAGTYSDYKTTMSTLASRGTIAIYVQYATQITVSKELEVDANYTHDPYMMVRYKMLMSGLLQGLEAVVGNSSRISNLDILMNNNTVDLDNMLILGHSMGGGMVPWVATEMIKKGWADNRLVLDMEAPYITLQWEGFDVDMSILPNNTWVNVVGYDEDHLVSQCIGMRQYERMISRDNSSDLNHDNIEYLLIQSDRYGFPRLVATHYLPADALIDPLSIYGYYKRIDAMAAFIAGDDTASTYFLGDNAWDMGLWSDGIPVNSILHSDDPFGIRSGPELLSKLKNTGHEYC